MAVLDTNVLLRYLLDDDPKQSPRAVAFLEEVESGQRTITVPEGVLVEVIQVLSSRRSYNVDRETIVSRITAVLLLPHVQITNKQVYLQALSLYFEYSRLSFVDALCASFAQHSADKTVISFDGDFRNLPDLVWEQP
jgi:predicted nucleic acid-binding protein